MRRVVVIGVSGAGKTTLALQLAECLNFPCIHAEAFAWNVNWTPVPGDVLRDRIAGATEKDRWVFDGDRFVLRDSVWRRADTLFGWIILCPLF